MTTSSPSIAPSAPGPARLSRTERQWLLALGMTLGLIALFAGIAAIERSVSRGGGRATRFIWDASEASARFLAIAHTIVATAFLLTSKKVRRPGMALRLAGFTALGVAICFGFEQLGGIRAPIGGFLFYAYFIAHELRDEGYLSERNGDAGPPLAPTDARWLTWTPSLMAVIVLLAVGVAGAAFGGGARRLTALVADVAPAVRIGGGVLLLGALAGAAALLVRRTARAEGAPFSAHLSRRRPRIFVTVGLLAVLLLGAVATGKLYLVVALHVVWWAVFAYQGLTRAPAPAVRPRPLSWSWVRATPAGFAAFHAAVLLLVVGVAAAHALLAKNDPSWTVATVVAGRDAFPYWTLMHVSLSWLPRT